MIDEIADVSRVEFDMGAVADLPVLQGRQVDPATRHGKATACLT